MKKDNKTKKSSVMKKLVPATGMLLVSAIMLTTSTYAWFTMSREVEVTGLKMTATVPEDLQISLGAIYKADNSAIADEGDKLSLANSTGTIHGDDGATANPTNTWDWASLADISAYYQFGKLMPASSRDGATIFYTADATGSGRTVSSVAKYFAANSGLTAWQTGGTTTVSTDSAKAKLHAITAKTGSTKNTTTDTWDPSGAAGTTYLKATGWDKTNDDGYYVDIPIWLRSSATEDINVKVEGYVLPQSGNTGKTDTQIELYRSVRVALLNGDTQGIKPNTSTAATATSEGAVVLTNNILPLVDALDKTKVDGNGKYTDITSISNPFTATTNNPVILDSTIFHERTTQSGTDLYAVNTLSNYSPEDVTADKTGHITASDQKANYTTYTAYDGTSAVATVKANTTSDAYGDAKKLWIRVWLDGEDEECWNDNAGQDWAISLRFTKVDIPNS